MNVNHLKDNILKIKNLCMLQKYYWCNILTGFKENNTVYAGVGVW